MKRIEISNEKAPNFIGCWFLEEKNISKGIIDFFENNQYLQKKGSTYKGVQENRKKFCQKYIYSSANYQEEWLKRLL